VFDATVRGYLFVIVILYVIELANEACGSLDVENNYLFPEMPRPHLYS
jgi:hypothetical protein